MILILATGAALASVFAYTTSLAFTKRVWPAIAIIGLGIVVVTMFALIETLMRLPSDILPRSFSDPEIVELYAIAICLEALIAAAVLWHASSESRPLRNALLYLPLPTTAGVLLAITQLTMIHGPRINLQLLGWVGLLTSIVFLTGCAMLARIVKTRAADFLLELSLLLRLLAALFAAAMISVQLHRPTPVLDFEVQGLLLVVPICVVLVSYGYFRRPHY